jgi:tagaturonate reductase
MATLPESILQFGSGRFLRAFVDLFIHQGNEAGQAVGRVVVVQSTGDGRAGGLNQQGGAYHVIIRGYEAGQVIDRVERCASISRALHAGSQWPLVLELARSPDLTTILSNTTEAGYTLDPEDHPQDAVPRSFPAKLLAVLRARFDAGQPGCSIIPCELLEGNATILRNKVLDYALAWGYPAEFLTWVQSECAWQGTLVDRIVTGTPAEHPLLATDPLAIVAEPFAFFALEDHPKARFRLEHPAITRAAQVEPYFLRKVRILNAAHTALLIRAVPRGFKIVRHAMQDAELSAWLRGLLFEEIVPTLAGRVEHGERFAEQTIDRFLNPFLDHQFKDIALHHGNKIQVRLVPTREEFAARFGRPPARLTEVIQTGLDQLSSGIVPGSLG